MCASGLLTVLRPRAYVLMGIAVGLHNISSEVAL